MKTKLTFLLSLTFLFLFSGSVYGGVIDETIDDVFDRKDGVVVLSCYLKNKGYYSYVVLNRKDKVIKYFPNKRENTEKYGTFEIVEGNDVFIKGKDNNHTIINKTTKKKEKGESVLFITKHIYENHIHIRWERHENIYYGNNKIAGKYINTSNHKCSIGDKVF